MGVVGRGLHLDLPEELPEHGQALAGRQHPARKAVPEVMNSYVLKACPFADAPPWALQFGEVKAGELAGDRPRIAILAGNR